MKCRNSDTEQIRLTAIKANIIQQNKKGLNKLELAGRAILQDMGIEFKEQELMFNKFLIDVVIPKKKLIIQWDGDYWHSIPKRKKLDQSQDAYMTKCGYKVLRIPEHEIKNDRDKVYADITRAIQ